VIPGVTSIEKRKSEQKTNAAKRERKNGKPRRSNLDPRP
jgi:hypothetical protein